MDQDRHALHRQWLRRKLARNAVIVCGLILAALGIGAAGYHFLDGLDWLDATLNAAMILTGMGPVNPVERPAAKVLPSSRLPITSSALSGRIGSAAT